MTLLNNASLEAMACARAYRARIVASQHPLEPAERLRRRAARAARSPLALDQLFALCLQATAEDARADVGSVRTLLAPPAALDELAMRQTILASPSAAPKRAELAAIVAAEELRAGRKVGRNPRKLSEHLHQAAQLARQLWDHPELLASPKVRAAMLSAAPALEARAEVLLRRPPPHDRPLRGREGEARPMAAV